MKALWFLFLLLTAISVRGDEPEYPLLPADTSSPRATLNSFMESTAGAYELLKTAGRGTNDQKLLADARDYVRRIKRCMDLTDIADFQRDNVARETAVMLKEILDRIELPKEKQIPDLKAMSNEDGSLIDKWTIPNTEITFRRVTEGPREGAYLFSPDTVNRAGEFLKRVEHLPYKKGATDGFADLYLTSPGSVWVARLITALPESMKVRKHGQAVWQWIGLCALLLLAAIVMALIYSIGRQVSRGGPETGMLKYILGLVFPIAATFIPAQAQYIISTHLVITGSAYSIVKFNLSLVTLFAAMVVVMGIGRRVGEVVASAPHFASRSIDAQLIRIMTRLLGFMGAMVLLLQGGQHLGIPLSSLLAGAGVVGMALALSAQDMLKNVFGSIMLVMDKPFVVGERIKVMKYDGVVEEIGLRSTRLRLLNGHQTSIPNEAMARADIENVGRRPFIRRVSTIPLAIDIPPAKARQAVELVQEVLEDHEGFNPDFPPRVWLKEFERDHLELAMIYWYHPPDYWRFTAHSDQVNRQILGAFETNGIRISVPRFTTRVEDESGAPVVLPAR